MVQKLTAPMLAALRYFANPPSPQLHVNPPLTVTCAALVQRGWLTPAFSRFEHKLTDAGRDALLTTPEDTTPLSPRQRQGLEFTARHGDDTFVDGRTIMSLAARNFLAWSGSVTQVTREGWVHIDSQVRRRILHQAQFDAHTLYRMWQRFQRGTKSAPGRVVEDADYTLAARDLTDPFAGIPGC